MTLSPARITSRQALLTAIESGAALDGCLVLGLDLDAALEAAARARGAVVFPPLPKRPYDPYRTALYTPTELMRRSAQGSDPSESVDEAIAAHFDAARARPGLLESLAQRLHDHAIEEALDDVLGREPADRLDLVGFMGGHSAGRDGDSYARVAHTAFRLARAGFRVVTGGGPGMMEAANLGAYLAQGYELADLDAALSVLARTPRPPEGREWRAQPGGWERFESYLDRAREVLGRFPRRGPAGRPRNIAVPTWFYGWEPSNLFADAVAKYFSNSLREDGLLAISVGGVVYAPGSLGTTQEIFVDAAQNHYGSYEYVSPMAFLGVDHYTQQTAHWTLLQQLSAGRPWGRLMVASDSPEEIADFIMRNRPLRREGAR